MKKTILPLALLAGTTSAAQAQGLIQNMASRVSFGVKGGGSATGFTGSGASGLTYRLGFTAGGFMNLQITEHLSMQQDFLYAQKGAEMDNFLSSNHTLQSRLGYLDVPVTLRYTFRPGGTGFFLEAGISSSLLLSQKTTVENSAGHEVASLGTRKDDYTSFLTGYVGGLGYAFGNGLQLGARYNGDFTALYKKDQGYPELQHSVAQVQLAYVLGGRRK